MVAALKACKARCKVGCITNNVATGQGQGMAADGAASRATAEIFALFDHVIESSKVGVRKPDPEIYRMMCAALAVEPSACVYLDDLGINCKAAASLGMAAIKVVTEDQALAELARLTRPRLPHRRRSIGDRRMTTAPLTGAKIGAAAALEQLAGWSAVDGRDAIRKSFRFPDFSTAFAWMVRVAMVAEKLDHHPEWSNIYNKVEVVLATHDVDGVSDKDVRLAWAMDGADTL